VTGETDRAITLTARGDGPERYVEAAGEATVR
jgi:hypothetical protein